MTITKLMNIKCSYCDKGFSKRRLIGQEHYFCSQVCRSKASTIYLKKGNYYPCFWCEKQVYKRPSDTEKSRHLFCSKLCNNKWRKGKTFAPPHTLYKKGEEPFNKNKTYEELYGDKKAKELKEINKVNRLRNWNDLEYRKKQMKHRTPIKLKNFRMKGLEYSNSEENIIRLKSKNRKGKVISQIINQKLNSSKTKNK